MGLTYRDSGVDINAGNELVTRIKDAASRTHRPELLTNLGGFAALARLPDKYREPVLVTGTDGVGTKLALAIKHDRHDTVGQDLVAMCVNDALVSGAEPFLFLDYYATGKLDVDVAERVIKGIAAGCELAGCALVGGETAEMPGFYATGDYDLAGFCVGIVEREEILTGDRVDVGDVLVGLASSGPHSNGFSLIRRIIDSRGVQPDASMLEELLAPTRIYVDTVLAIVNQTTGLAHLTGGGFVENLPRMFTRPIAADIDLDSWSRPAIFGWLQQAGNVEELEMLRTFNCGIGFVAAVPAHDAQDVVTALREAGEDAHVIGTMVEAGKDPDPGHLIVEHGACRLG